MKNNFNLVKYLSKGNRLLKENIGGIVTLKPINSVDTLRETYGAEMEDEPVSDYPDMGAAPDPGDMPIGTSKNRLDSIVTKMKQLAMAYKSGDTSVVPQLKALSAEKRRLEAELLDVGQDDSDAGF